MKYLNEIAVLALVIIAVANVYRIVHHKQHCRNRDNVAIQNSNQGHYAGPGY